MTFSITARCPDTGMVGVGVSTALLCVGALCPFTQAGVGAVSTQSFVNPYIGIKGLELLAGDLDATTVVARLAAWDPGQSMRQFSVVDRRGNAAAFSGADCVGWFGHRTGAGYAVAGNMLVGEATIADMASAFEASAGLHLAERIVRALEAAQAAGGDRRGRISSALKISAVEDYPLIDIRVDDHPDPVAQLRALWNKHQTDLLPIMAMMPSKAVPAGRFNLDEIRQHLPSDS